MILLRRDKGTSIVKRLRAYFVVIMALLLIPAIVSMLVMTNYALRYHSLIRQVERASLLTPVVRSEIPDEVWSVVAGRKTFAEGAQYDMCARVNAELNALSQSAYTANPMELNVVRRAMSTLISYVDRMGEQMKLGVPVKENEALLEEVRSVAALVGDMLEEYITVEIAAAADASNQLQQMLILMVILIFMLVLVAILFAALAQRSLSKAIHIPLMRLEQFAGSIASGNLGDRVPDAPVEELAKLSESLNIMANKLQLSVEENRREQENLKKSELRTLQAQVAPHFLYNTLDAIVWLAESQRMGEVIHITRALSDFFRISLSQGRDWIPLGEEIKHLQGYLTIQKVRYRDILDYEIDIPEALHGVRVLKLITQPLVENAIYHGVKHRRGRGRVVVRAREEDGWLSLSVCDDGAGMTPERLEAVRRHLSGADDSEDAGYGLFNVNKRICLYYNLDKGLTIESDESGTKVSMRVPARRIEHV